MYDSGMLEHKFWSKVDIGNPLQCWRWNARLSAKGYGEFDMPSGRKARAHRIAYTLKKGEIPSGLVIDHICRTRHCCNPAHLRAVTNAENVLCGIGVTAENSRKTHCLNGHELSGWNLMPKIGGRECRRCAYDRDNARKRRLRAERKAKQA